MEKYFLGIDNGGSIIKAALFDQKGKEASVAVRRVPISSPQENWVERDLHQVWEANVQVISEVIKDAGIESGQIDGIGITGYGNGICLVDKEGNPVYPAIVSNDNRAEGLCNRLVEEGVEKEVYPLTGQTFWASQTAVLAVWMKENNVEILKKADMILSIKDYIRMKLTGEFCYEMTEGTCSGFINVHKNILDPKIFQLLGIEEYINMMPKYVGVTEISGRITKKAARQTGLKEGTVVAGGCYDVNSCALANGILSDDTLCMVTGTWSINEVLTKKFIEGAESVARSYHPGYYILEESSPTSAGNLDWFIEQILIPEDKKIERSELYTICNQMVEDLPPEESNTIFVPYLYASNTTPEAEAAFFNLKSTSRRQHMIRAIYEGIVFSALLHIGRIKDHKISFRKAKLCGGIAKSEVWSQMVCDALQMPLEVMNTQEPGALGAAICAAIASGFYPNMEEATAQMVHIRKIYQPNASKERVYKEKYNHYIKALKALNYFYGGEGTI